MNGRESAKLNLLRREWDKTRMPIKKYFEQARKEKEEKEANEKRRNGGNSILS